MWKKIAIAVSIIGAGVGGWLIGTVGGYASGVTDGVFVTIEQAVKECKKQLSR